MFFKPKNIYEKLICILYVAYIFSVYAFPFQVLKVEIIFLGFLLFKIRKIKINFYLIWSFMFFSIVILSVIFSKDPFISFIGAMQILKILVLNNILILVSKNKREVYFFLNTFIVAGIVLILRLLTLVPLENLGNNRLQIIGMFNANDVGLKLSLSLIFLLYFIFLEKKYKLYYLVNVPILYLFIFFTGSKKAFVFSVLSLVLIILLSLKNKKKLVYYIPLIILGLFLIFRIIMEIPVFYNVLGYRLEAFLSFTEGNSRIDGSTLERLSMIKEGIDLFSEELFLGYGLEGFALNTNFGHYSHNNYVEMLVNFGIIGFIVYYTMYFYLMVKNIKLYLLRNKIIIPFLINIIIVFIIEMAMISYKDRFFYLVLGLNFMIIELSKNRRYYLIRRKI